MTTLCTTLLSDLGVLGSIEVQELQLGLIPLEKDVLSLEYEETWKKTELVRPLALPRCSCASLLTCGNDRTETIRASMTWPKRS